jgi:hypothetical protein
VRRSLPASALSIAPKKRGTRPFNFCDKEVCVNQRHACRCPSCSGVHQVELDPERTGGIDVDQQCRPVIICRWCMRHCTTNTLQLLDRERASRVNDN